jgi:erythromycin esterase-like protein
MNLVGDARFVLIGESTHGTHEFYRDRARITQRLIAEKGFTGVAIEGDWPDAERVNQFVRAEKAATPPGAGTFRVHAPFPQVDVGEHGRA